MSKSPAIAVFPLGRPSPAAASGKGSVCGSRRRDPRPDCDNALRTLRTVSMTKSTATLPGDSDGIDADLDVPTRRSGTYSLPPPHLPVCEAAGLSVCQFSPGRDPPMFTRKGPGADGVIGLEHARDRGASRGFRRRTCNVRRRAFFSRAWDHPARLAGGSGSVRAATKIVHPDFLVAF